MWQTLNCIVGHQTWTTIALDPIDVSSSFLASPFQAFIFSYYWSVDQPWHLEAVRKNIFLRNIQVSHMSIVHCLCSYRLWWKLRIYHGLEIRMCLCSLCKALACPLLWPYQMVFLPWPKMSCNFSFIQRWLAVRHMYTLYRICTLLSTSYFSVISSLISPRTTPAIYHLTPCILNGQLSIKFMCL